MSAGTKTDLGSASETVDEFKALLREAALDILRRAGNEKLLYPDIVVRVIFLLIRGIAFNLRGVVVDLPELFLRAERLLEGADPIPVEDLHRGLIALHEVISKGEGYDYADAADDDGGTVGGAE